jgi:YbgC/YbaW family acyl-CoA thioester hydrolase
LKKLAETGIVFVVRDVNIIYKAPAYYGDTLKIVTKIEEIKSASLLIYQEACRNEDLLVSARTTLACVNIKLNPVVIPQEILTCIRNI